MFIKLYIVITVAVCIGYLNATLFISQYLSIDIFNSNAEATSKIRPFFRREIGAINLITAIKRNILMNSTQYTNIYDADMNLQVEDAVPYYEKFCMDAENEITSILRSPPSYLTSAMTVIS